MGKLLQYGSQGGDVNTLQQNLNNHGYNLSVDGSFGKNTLSAVRDFQSKNGLGVDGLVGTKTQSMMKGVGKTPTPPTATQPGDYTSQWQAQLDDIMYKINNREKFSYDVNGDALYQQYKDQYINQAKMARQDAMGQAAAMTGGYGNSYAASVGNQAYQASLSQLNNVIPELYQMAYDRYEQKGQDLLNQYSMLTDRDNSDYSKFIDDRNYDESVRQFNETMDFNAANANVAKNTKTGTYTPKATSMSSKEYNDVLNNAETWANMGETQFALYINSAIENGFPSQDAQELYDLYFPEEEVPVVKKPGANYSGGGGGGKDRIVHTLN
jgi:peptidoglycan hydrolase-like protein with peptidoglycan-binding domain